MGLRKCHASVFGIPDFDAGSACRCGETAGFHRVYHASTSLFMYAAVLGTF